MEASEDSRRRRATVLRGLQKGYAALSALEARTQFAAFFTAAMTDQELAAKPHVLVLGQYSTGKTTFINKLVGDSYESSHVGPEPTTDRFVAVAHGDERGLVLGNAASIQPTLPYQGLVTFGQNFLSKFSVAFTPSKVLKEVTFVDTPGVLSGEKQRRQRSYDFSRTSRWFAERADLILLMFDAHKLDISDEFKEVIAGLKGLENKVRCVLNKADQIDSARLIRVYGALLFNIGKILQTPEVVRVFIGSFRDQEPEHKEYLETFAEDEKQLLSEIADLPRGALSLKMDELVRRARLAKVHACVLDKLRRSTTFLYGDGARQEALIAGMKDVFAQTAKEYSAFGISEGDFPDAATYAAKLRDMVLQGGPGTFRRLPRLDARAMARIDRLLDETIPKLSRFAIPDTTGIDEVDPLSAFDDDDEATQRAGAALAVLTNGVAGMVILAAAVGVGIYGKRALRAK